MTTNSVQPVRSAIRITIQNVRNLFHRLVQCCAALALFALCPPGSAARGSPGSASGLWCVGDDDVIVARASRLERWSGSPLRLRASIPVPGTVLDVIPYRGRLVAQTAHALYERPASLSRGARILWRTPRRILRAAPFGSGWLVLTCMGERSGHPLGGLVTYVTRRGAQQLTLLPRYNFWELQVGDVDGDGRPEVALCTWSKTRIIPVYARRYFVYGWDGRDVYPRWRGSRLSKPYEQARLVRLDASRQDRLLAVEVTRDGRRCLTAYRWNDFGFTGLAAGREWDRIRILDSPAGAPPLIRAGSGGTEAVYSLSVRQDKLLAHRICSVKAGSLVAADVARSGAIRVVTCSGEAPRLARIQWPGRRRYGSN